MIPVTGPMANAAATDPARAATAAIPTVRRRASPAATGLSLRPATASRPASKKSLDQPMESWPARTAGTRSTGPVPRGAASAASTAIIAVMASDGPG